MTNALFAMFIEDNLVDKEWGASRDRARSSILAMDSLDEDTASSSDDDSSTAAQRSSGSGVVREQRQPPRSVPAATGNPFPNLPPPMATAG
jgi:hypothetical protein